MLDQMQILGYVLHVENQGPYDKGGVQFTAMKRADRLNIVRTADWVLTLDANEFVNIHVGDGTVGALFAAFPRGNGDHFDLAAFWQCRCTGFSR